MTSRLSPAGYEWFDGQMDKLREAYSERTLHITIGLIPRRLGKQDLALNEDERAAAQVTRTGWDPRNWSVADAARTLVLLETNSVSNQPFVSRFVDLCRTADVAELIGLYRALPVYPDAQDLEPQAGEGLRSNMRTVFEAVAHHNPYPREIFTQDRWNQMVLKALFVDSLLDPIVGLDERANPELARIMCDYAHERWAASRDISPEVWRCVGPMAEGEIYGDPAKAATSANPTEAKAALLSLVGDQSNEAQTIRDSRPDVAAAAGNDEYTWQDIARAVAETR